MKVEALGVLNEQALDAFAPFGSSPGLEFDLHSVRFIEPCGLVALACLAEHGAAEGDEMSLRLPKSGNATEYLSRMNVGRVLRERCGIRDALPTVRRADLRGGMLEVQRFETEDGADELADILEQRLSYPLLRSEAASPTPVAPTRNAIAPQTKPAIAKTRTSQSPVAVPGSSGEAQVAAFLIAAINQQANRQGAIPVTANNIGLLPRWMANEGGLWANNPLNTSHGSAAYPHQFTTSGQDTGILIFPTLSSGIAATAATLLSNPSYARVLRVLRSGTASCVSFARAVIQSPWASGHYSHDPAGFCSGRIVPVRRDHKRHHAG